MPRILLLITDLEIGGTPTVVRELAIRLGATNGTVVQVACLSRWGPVADQLTHAGISVTALEAESVRSFPRIAHRLSRLVRDRKIDVVFSFLMHANAVAAAASLFTPGVRWLQSIQTTQPTPRWHWWIQSIAQYAAERIVVPSPSVAQVAMAWAGVPAEKILVIPNAVDTCGTDFQPVLQSKKEACETNLNEFQHGLESRATVAVGFIGRLDPIKRIPDLLSAMTFLDPHISLHIFGEGAERENLEQLIRKLNLHDRVTLHGAIDQPAKALSKMNVLVLPSQAEGFGLVLIEAMSAGVPVVATNVPGIRDVVKNGETGSLVPIASPAALAGAIKTVLTNPQLRSALITQAMQDVHQRFSWDVVLPQYQKLLAPTD